MKKFFAIFILVAVLSGAWYGPHAASGGFGERGNNKKSIEAARDIAKLTDVRETAVLSLDGYVIAGVSVFDNANREEICMQGENILKKFFPDSKTYRIEAGTEWADKVIELSFYLDAKVKRRILRKRFLYLVAENREI